MEKLGVTVNLTSGYHPQANGQVEQANQEVSHFLHTFFASNPEDWAQFLMKTPKTPFWDISPLCLPVMPTPPTRQLWTTGFG